MPDQYDNLADYSWLMNEVLRHETEQAMALGKLLTEKLSPKSVIDIGCGPGIYLVPFKQAGIEIHGIDGCPPPEGGKSIDPGEFEVVDLRGPWQPAKLYDLGLCIELAEHLKPEYHDNLVSIIAASCTTLFFSAATPGQGGEGHYGERPVEYWREKLAAYGFHNHPLHDEVDAAIKAGQAYEHTHWLKWHSDLWTKLP